MLNYSIELIKHSPFIFSVFLLFVALLITLICEWIISFTLISYFAIQEWLLTKSNRNNKLFISKLVIILYKSHKKIVALLIRILPFSFKKYESNDRFEPKLLKTSSRKNVCTVLICLGFSLFINVILNYINQLSTIWNTVLNSNYIGKGISFVSENKILLLTTLGVFCIVYSVFRDKFTNKIILQIHDEELKNIIITHKELFMDFIVLRNILCKNIDHFFDIYKEEDGVIFQLHNNISKMFPAFRYDAEQKSFQKTDTSSSKYYHPLSTDVFGYIEIGDVIEKMNLRITKFKDSNSFYNTSAINKYVKGLDGFDITRAIQKNNTSTLLCEEFFSKLCKEYPEHQTNVINDCSYDDEFKIKLLNERLSLINNHTFSVALETIEYAIDIERYIDKFSKVFALKTRRKQLSLDQILERYK